MVTGYLLHFVGKGKRSKAQSMLERAPFVLQTLMLVLLIFTIIQVRSSEIQPFIYFQF